MKGTGGSAFPTTPDNETRMNGNGGTGMTLRDYFAGQVLIGEVSSQSDRDGWINSPDAFRDVAAKSYAIADAMIAERAKS